jgi:hypothetical protein
MVRARRRLKKKRSLSQANVSTNSKFTFVEEESTKEDHKEGP